jgi:23S rRNA (cytidine1920-2'-O)/16S rRNA (cytidine1409-2'-O)-methyltransferase
MGNRGVRAQELSSSWSPTSEMARRRADILAVEQGLAQSRSRAQALILAGAVMYGPDRKVEKPGDLLDASAQLSLKGEPLPYVSRGGLKLAAAIAGFDVEVRERVCLDVGASTGGFSDCLLQHGARRVYAVDVGYGQLAWSLRQDPRVVVLERSNIRNLDPALIREACSLIVIDVSFISLRIVIPAALRFAAPAATLVALVKPQFEVGPKDVGKGGVVRDPALREQALARARQYCIHLGLIDITSMESPILGAQGNHEYLLYARRPSGVADAPPSGW